MNTDESRSKLEAGFVSSYVLWKSKTSRSSAALSRSFRVVMTIYRRVTSRNRCAATARLYFIHGTHDIIMKVFMRENRSVEGCESVGMHWWEQTDWIVFRACRHSAPSEATGVLTPGNCRKTSTATEPRVYPTRSSAGSHLCLHLPCFKNETYFS